MGRDFMIEGMTWDGEGCERVTITLDTIPRGLLVSPLADLPTRVRAPTMHEVSAGRFTWTATSGTANAPAPGLTPSDGARMDLATRLRDAHRQRDLRLQQEREAAAALAHPPPRPLQARHSALPLVPAQQHPVLRPMLPMPTSYGCGRSRSVDGSCNVKGCPGAKRARASGTRYSHVLAHILRSEPSTSSREHTGIYGGPEPGTSGEALAPILCSGTHSRSWSRSSHNS